MDGDGDDGDGEFFNESNTTTLEDTRAKDLFTTITTRDGFVAASWEESQTHLLLFLGLWAGLLLVSLTMGISRRIWSPDSLNKQLGMQIAVLKHSAYWNIFMFLLLSSLVVLYVLRAERIRLDENLTFLEITAVSFYAIEAFINWFYYSSGGIDGIIRFFWSYMMVVCLVIPSVLYRSLSGQQSHFSFAFCASIRASQIYKEWVTFHRRGRVKFMDHLTMYAGTFFSGAFSMAMLIRELESLEGVDPNFLNGSEPPDGINATVYARWSLFASFYIMLLNTSKVGFGDLLPRNPVAQFFSLVGTCSCVYLMATVMLKVLKLNEAGGLSRPKYPNRAGYRHVVVTGSASLQVYIDFLHEFFHVDNASETDDIDVVILHLAGQRSVMQQLQSYLGKGGSEDLRILRKVWMVEGSALKAEDLDRARFSSASAAFLLPNMYGSDPEKEDVGNLMRALTMKRHTSYIRVVCMMMKAHSMEGLLAVGVPRQDIICFDSVLQGLIGKAAEVQGYLPLPASMLKTSKALSNAEITKKGLIWAEDYAMSLGMTLFDMELPSSYKTVPFCEVATDICERSGYKAFLIGLAEEALYPTDSTEFVLFPNKYYRVGLQKDRDVKGLILARAKEDVKMALPGRAIRWSPDQWVSNTAQVQVNPHLSSLKAEKDKEGWVRDHFIEEQSKQEYLTEKLVHTAKRRAAMGLIHGAKMSRIHVESYLEDTDDDLFDMNDALEDVMEDPTSDVMKDPFERALLERRMKSKQQILAEKEKLDTEAADDVLYGENESIRLGLQQIHLADEAEVKLRTPDPIVLREDEVLWGSAVQPAEKIWANAKEPPEEVLVRGEHVLVLSLESDLPEDAANDEEDVVATGKRRPMRPGRALPLETFIRSLRCQRKRRPIVVVSRRVPVDWARVMNEPSVFLVLGVPFSPQSLQRAGFVRAKSVVIYQRDVTKCTDAALVDSKAIFAQRLVEALLHDAGRKNVPVIMHIHLEVNTELMTETSEPKKAQGLLEMLESKRGEDEEEDTGGPTRTVEAEEMQQIILQHRFASGMLMSSNLLTCLMANAMFQPSLAAVIDEMSRAAFTVVEVPPNWRGLTFGQLFSFMMRKRNMMPMALLRKTNAQDALDFIDSSVESRRVEDPEEKLEVLYGKVSQMVEDWRSLLDAADQKRWQPGGQPFGRYTLVMPAGTSFVVYNDGVLCMQPTTRTTLPQTGVKRERFDDPLSRQQLAAMSVKS